MAGSDKVGFKQFQPFKQPEPLDLFVADHTGVRCPASEIVIMKVVDHILPELPAEVERQHRNLKIGMVADDERGRLERGALLKGVKHPDVQPCNCIARFFEQAGSCGRVHPTGYADYYFLLFTHKSPLLIYSPDPFGTSSATPSYRS